MIAEPIVKLENVNIKQRNELVLSEVNVILNKGDFAYLIGKTGTGKSSLLKTLYGDLKIDSGIGKVAGFDLNKLKDKEIPFLRRKLGVVFQDFQLLMDRNIYENLLFVLKATGWKNKKEIESRINQSLESVNLIHKKNTMPHRLSGGEQQRIAIARALLNEPELILADEPTGNLDPETSEEIIKILIGLCQNNRAVLVATHDLALMISYPARTIRCEDGKVFDSQAQ